MAESLEFKGSRLHEAADQIKMLYKLFVKVDATQIEINPFGETIDGQGMSRFFITVSLHYYLESIRCISATHTVLVLCFDV